jgi:hypothetical protein
MDRRERLFGIAEKLLKDSPEADPRRKVVALESRRVPQAALTSPAGPHGLCRHASLINLAMLKRLYDWTLSLAARKSAEAWLFIIAFVESSVFVIPAEVLVVPMGLARPERAYRYAVIATVGSVLGAIFGWFLGHYAYEYVARPMLEFYGSLETFEKLKNSASRDDRSADAGDIRTRAPAADESRVDRFGRTDGKSVALRWSVHRRTRPALCRDGVAATPVRRTDPRVH